MVLIRSLQERESADSLGADQSGKPHAVQISVNGCETLDGWILSETAQRGPGGKRDLIAV